MFNIKVCFCLQLKIKKQSKLDTSYKNFNKLFKQQNLKTHYEENKTLKLQTKSSKLLTFLILQRKRRKGKDWNRQGFCECRNENIFGDHQQEHRTKPRRERQPLRLLGRGQIRRRGLSVRLGRQPTHACHRAELRQTIRQRGALRGQMQWRIESTLPHRMSKTCRLRIRTFPRKFAAVCALRGRKRL